jgi:hypothetical protein|eukprot:6594442-Prymnesium_polylepis.2
MAATHKSAELAAQKLVGKAEDMYIGQRGANGPDPPPNLSPGRRLHLAYIGHSEVRRAAPPCDLPYEWYLRRVRHLTKAARRALHVPLSGALLVPIPLWGLVWTGLRRTVHRCAFPCVAGLTYAMADPKRRRHPPCGRADVPG